MLFTAHGDYEIKQTGEVFILSFFHNWNLECAKSFFSEYKKTIQQSHLETFAVLSDLSQFEGGTPDAIDFFQKISDWAQENGQVARALIVDTSIKKYTINKIDKGKSRFPIQIVKNQEEAMAWFKSLGLSIA